MNATEESINTVFAEAQRTIYEIEHEDELDAIEERNKKRLEETKAKVARRRARREAAVKKES